MGRESTVKAGRTLSGLLFFELLFLAFRAMFAALFTFPNEYKMVRPAETKGCGYRHVPDGAALCSRFTTFVISR